MNWQVTGLKYLDGYRLLLTFRDGSKKVVDLKNHIRGEIFEPLKDINYFMTVKLNPELDTIYWDNGADFAPEFLYDAGVVADAAALRVTR